MRRAEDVAPYQEVAVETATEATVTLSDDDPHRSSDFASQSELRSADTADKAFYTIGVSVP